MAVFACCCSEGAESASEMEIVQKVENVRNINIGFTGMFWVWMTYCSLCSDKISLETKLFQRKSPLDEGGEKYGVLCCREMGQVFENTVKLCARKRFPVSQEGSEGCLLKLLSGVQFSSMAGRSYKKFPAEGMQVDTS